MFGENCVTPGTLVLDDGALQLRGGFAAFTFVRTAIDMVIFRGRRRARSPGMRQVKPSQLWLMTLRRPP